MQLPKTLPPGARPIDAITPDQIAIATGVTTTLLKITVPNSVIAIIEGFGHALETSSAFDYIEWSFKINGLFISSMVNWEYDVAGTLTKGEQYRNIKAMLGPLYEPFRFGSPFIVKAKQTFEVIAKNTDAGTHYALARLIGYAYPFTVAEDAIEVNKAGAKLLIPKILPECQ